MKLPFAVYTARNGYAWQSGTDAGIAKLDRLRKAIGKMPEFDFGDAATSGMLNAGDEIVLYRFMRQDNADAHGRAASYLAMTFFPRNDSRFVNADSILSSPPFARPMAEPPSWLDYNGPPAIPSDFSPPLQDSSGCFDPSGSLASAGFVFSQPIGGALRISRREPEDGKGALFQYRTFKPTSRQELLRPSVPPGKPSSIQVVQTNATDIWKWIAGVAIILAFAEALALSYLLLARKNIDSPTQDAVSIPAPIEEQASPSEGAASDVASPEQRENQSTPSPANQPEPPNEDKPADDMVKPQANQYQPATEHLLMQDKYLREDAEIRRMELRKEQGIISAGQSIKAERVTENE